VSFLQLTKHTASLVMLHRVIDSSSTQAALEYVLRLDEGTGTNRMQDCMSCSTSCLLLCCIMLSHAVLCCVVSLQVPV
jgi:hypothetical protein